MAELRERLGNPRTGAVIAIALAVAVVAWLLLRSDDGGNDNGNSSGSASKVSAREASEVSVDDLRNFAADAGQPVYWAGEQAGKKLELTVSDTGNVFVRYLDPATEIGARTGALTIGTYPVANAYAAVQKTGDKPGTVTAHVGNGGLIASEGKKAQNAYLAFPDASYQIEVYDPTPGEALAIAKSGAIQPVD